MTDEEIRASWIAHRDELLALLADRDRGGFYVLAASITGDDDLILPAEISTFSGFVGGLAAPANMMLNDSLGRYPDIYDLSQQVAEAFFAVYDDLAHEGQSMDLTFMEAVEVGRVAWGAYGDMYPGNLLLIADGQFDRFFTWGSSASLLQFMGGTALFYGKSLSDFAGKGPTHI